MGIVDKQEFLDRMDEDMAEMDAGPTAEAAVQEQADEAERQRIGGIIRELAALPPLDYEMRRLDAARDLGIRAGVLDREVAAARGEASKTQSSLIIPDVTPWSEPVDGAALLEEMTATFRRFLVLPTGAAEAMAFWVLHTHCLDAADFAPRLVFTSPEKRCGKTTAMAILGRLVARPLAASNISSAGVFRTVEALHPTLLIDEADTFLKDKDELRGVINSGHARDNAFVIRTVGDNHEPAKFSTWAGIAVALIGKLPGTIEDRSIEIRMMRRHRGEKIERFRRQNYATLGVLSRKAARWAQDNMAAMTDNDPDSPPDLHDRAADNWRPLFSIADRAGGGWERRARDAALKLSGEQADSSAGVMLLSDIRELFTEQNTDRLKSAFICDALAEMEGRPWQEWNRGKRITPAQLARRLQHYDISPDTIRIGGQTPKGYMLDWFRDAFARYLPPEAATPQQANGEREFSDFKGRNMAPDVAAAKSAENTTERSDVPLLRPEEGISTGGGGEPVPDSAATGATPDSKGVKLKPCPYFKGANRQKPCERCGFNWAEHYPDYS